MGGVGCGVWGVGGGWVDGLRRERSAERWMGGVWGVGYGVWAVRG